MFKKIKPLLLLLSLVLLFSGCSSSQERVEKTESSKGYPMTIVDSYEREVELLEEPQTIVSLAPNITETIYALGAESRLIGRTDFCDFPKEASEIESVGNLTNPNIEKIVELNPDLVIASTHFQKEVLEKLEESDIKVAVLYGEDTFEGAYQTIEKVGEAINSKGEAESLVSDMKAKVEDIKSRVEGRERPSVYYVVSYGESGDFTATGETYISEMIDMAGGSNIAEDAEGWMYSLEKLLENDPDIVICSENFNTKEGIESANGYSDLTAVKEGRLYEIDNDKLDRQGPRLADGLEELAKTIHPDAFN